MDKLSEAVSPDAVSPGAPKTEEEVVRTLMAAREQRLPIPAQSIIDEHIDSVEAYRLQRAHISAMLQRFGGATIGYKLVGRDPAALAARGYAAPLHGPIFSAFTQRSPASFKRDDFLLCAVEMEIGLLLGNDLDGARGPLAPREIKAAIQAVVPCIEIADARFADLTHASPAAVVADLGFAGAVVQGSPTADWRQLELSDLSVSLRCNGAEVRQGTGLAGGGNPIDNLGALATALARHGQRLLAGQLICTGTYIRPYPAQPGDFLEADFGQLGKVTLAIQ